MCYIINDKAIIKYIFMLFVHNDIYETVINFILKTIIVFFKHITP